jgi:SAM-dependent methyltransferase
MATTAEELREEVRRRYAESARAVSEGSGECGCGSGSCCEGATESPMFGEALYDAEQRGELPQAATLASLGCGNPTAVAELREGETVLDLGSGGGIDVISNCVINLSTDKAAVLTEIARVLKPGGRVGVSDVVAEDRLSPEERAERGSYVGCIAGALSRSEYVGGLEAAGFEDVSVEFTHEVADGMHGAIVKAVKTSEPARKGLPVIQPAGKAGCC